jgi:hypothetical protein
LPTPASVYELQLTVVPDVEQLAVPDLKCVPFGAFAGLVAAVATDISRAATTPSTAAATIDRFFRSLLGIAIDSFLFARSERSDRVLAGPQRTREEVPNDSGQVVYIASGLSTVGRRTTSFPSSPRGGQRGRARSRPAMQPPGETTSLQHRTRTTRASRSACSCPTRIPPDP